MGQVVNKMARPSGPLPARVYWTRRLLLLVVLVAVFALVWGLVAWAAGSSGEPPRAASGPAPAPSSTTTPTTTTDPTTARPARGDKPAAPSPQQKHSDKRHDRRHHRSPAKPERTPLARPTGVCDPTRVGMEIDVSDSEEGQGNTATFRLTSLDSAACTLAITPDNLVARITSGDDVVWSSSECPDALPAREVVVRADPPSAYKFSWDGRRSNERCQGLGEVAGPGGYWVEAAFVGGEPHKAFFDITARGNSRH